MDRKDKKIRSALIISFCLFSAAGLSSCFTGVEGTKKIELTKSDRKLLAPQPEETFVADIKGTGSDEWKPGKRFYVTDDRAVLAFRQKGMPLDPLSMHLGGSILTFTGKRESHGLSGEKETSLVFSNGAREFEYPVNTGAGHEEISSDKLPMMTDMDLVAILDSKLRGRQLWIKTPQWLSEDGDSFRGRKYVPVTITKATPGKGVNPYRLDFTDAGGKQLHIYMGSSGSRKFQSLFSLSDPLAPYTSVTEEVKELIRDGNVRPGMTKEECRLSLGYPDEADAGHSYSSTLDLWKYSNGRILFFEDGLLKEIQ